MVDILILYYSVNESTKKMARLISRGVESVDGANAVLRTVKSDKNSHEDSDPIADTNDLKNCSGLILGSPTHFGNMASPLKGFLDKTTAEWLQGTLTGKPAGVFTSTSSMHGGQETTLISMMLPLLHHGMLIVGVPYSEKSLISTKTGGTPYGPSHVSFNESQDLSNDEKEICKSFGARIAEITIKLNN
ncbi:MAG: NAD(P)H-quinone oxidoreductase [Gammaproteobacteria bacterium]|nr:NAD(P)H-quinone oxidoreductase [Gammaproteobacteria bacterium]|tara:strand:+ start:297 stop:863 length:567 start_codon:yes stop_codon:yes gene_type:complete